MDYYVFLIIAGTVAPITLQLVQTIANLLDTQTAAVRRAARQRRLNPVQAAAVDAAVARVVTAGHSGHTLQLPCRECGRRRTPPLAHVVSPPIPFERAGLVPLGAVGFVITATCTACGSPLISRVLDSEYADYARRLGVIDGEPLEAELRDWLATL